MWSWGLPVVSLFLSYKMLTITGLLHLENTLSVNKRDLLSGEMLQVGAVQFSLSALTPENQGDGVKTMHKNAATFVVPVLARKRRWKKGWGGLTVLDVETSDQTAWHLGTQIMFPRTFWSWIRITELLRWESTSGDHFVHLLRSNRAT